MRSPAWRSSTCQRGLSPAELWRVQLRIRRRRDFPSLYSAIGCAYQCVIDIEALCAEFDPNFVIDKVHWLAVDRDAEFELEEFKTGVREPSARIVPKKRSAVGASSQ